MIGLSGAPGVPTGFFWCPQRGRRRFLGPGYPMSLGGVGESPRGQKTFRAGGLWSMPAPAPLLQVPSPPQPPLSLFGEGHLGLSGKRVPAFALSVSRVMVLYSPDIVRETWFKRGRDASTWAPFCLWVGLGNTGSRVAFFCWV